MAEITNINDTLQDFIEDKNNHKVITSIGKSGEYHLSSIDYIEVVDDKTIRFPEYLEGSLTNRNLIYSLWFEKYIKILIAANDGEEITITGIPYRSYIEGSIFEEKYALAQEKYNGKVDLSTIWEVKVTRIERTDLLTVSAKEQETYPIVNHLDRIAKD